jgi:hypothetical protein
MIRPLLDAVELYLLEIVFSFEVWACDRSVSKISPLLQPAPSSKCARRAPDFAGSAILGGASVVILREGPGR